MSTMAKPGNGNKACYEELWREMPEETRRFEYVCLWGVGFVNGAGDGFPLPPVLALWC